MIEKNYRFMVEGRGAGEQTFKTEGILHCEFPLVFDRLMEETFKQLTLGKAIYGKPGVGCNGPYQISKVTIEELRQ